MAIYPAPTDRKSIQRRLGSPAFEARTAQGEIWREPPELLRHRAWVPQTEHGGGRGHRRVCRGGGKESISCDRFREPKPAWNPEWVRLTLSPWTAFPSPQASFHPWAGRQGQGSMVMILVIIRRLAGADLSRSTA